MNCLGPIEIDTQIFLNRVKKKGYLKQKTLKKNLFEKKIREICCQPWFFGDLSTKDAVNLLLKQKKDTFMVRFGNNPQFPGYFVVSKVSKSGKVIHIRIKHQAGSGFAVEGTRTEYITLPDLIEKAKDALHLSNESKPCAGSKFMYLFNPEDQHQVVGYKMVLDSDTLERI